LPGSRDRADAAAPLDIEDEAILSEVARAATALLLTDWDGDRERGLTRSPGLREMRGLSSKARGQPSASVRRAAISGRR
jgi:hypothetical protein